MINWRKGLFRLWIVSTIFWIIGSGVISFGEYNKAVKKETRIKLIVSETKNPEKALKQINTEFPESKQYGSIVNKDFVDMGPVDRSKAKIKLLGPVDKNKLKNPYLEPTEPHKDYSVDSESKFVALDEFIQGILKEICQKAENDKREWLYNSLCIIFIPPIILLFIGSGIFWALRGFGIRDDAKNYETK